MGSITTAGSSNWREAFEGHPGLAVTPENYEALLAAAGPEPVAAPEPGPEPEPEPAAVPDPILEDSTPPPSSPASSEAPSDEPDLVRLSEPAGDG